MEKRVEPDVGWSTESECNFIKGLGQNGRTREPRWMVLQRYIQGMKKRAVFSFCKQTALACAAEELKKESAKGGAAVKAYESISTLIAADAHPALAAKVAEAA